VSRNAETTVPASDSLMEACTKFSMTYENKRERMVDQQLLPRSSSFLAITVENMGLGDSQYISYSITVVYMHIFLMNPQCKLLWPHKCKDAS
jgi:hypothetical protein